MQLHRWFPDIAVLLSLPAIVQLPLLPNAHPIVEHAAMLPWSTDALKGRIYFEWGKSLDSIASIFWRTDS